MLLLLIQVEINNEDRGTTFFGISSTCLVADPMAYCLSPNDRAAGEGILPRKLGKLVQVMDECHKASTHNILSWRQSSTAVGTPRLVHMVLLAVFSCRQLHFFTCRLRLLNTTTTIAEQNET